MRPIAAGRSEEGTRIVVPANDCVVRYKTYKFQCSYWATSPLPCIDYDDSVNGLLKPETTAKAVYEIIWQVGVVRRSTRGGWTEEEDKVLEYAVQSFGAKNWKYIAKQVPNRTEHQCMHRWQRVLNPSIRKGGWTKEEDERIKDLVGKQGLKKWSKVAKHLPGRIDKQCRERWLNHLHPDINRTAWTSEEEMILIKAHGNYGNMWTKITNFLPGRTENMIKNHWNCLVKKSSNLCLPVMTTALHCPRITVPDLNDPSGLNKRGNPEVLKPYPEPNVSAVRTPIIERSTRTGIHHNGVPHTTHRSRPRVNSPLIGLQTDELENKLGGLCYQPLELEDLDKLLKTGSFPCTDSYLRHNSNATATVNSSSSKHSSPVSILKKAAKTFINIPSIIRRKSSI